MFFMSVEYVRINEKLHLGPEQGKIWQNDSLKSRNCCEPLFDFIAIFLICEKTWMPYKCSWICQNMLISQQRHMDL